jgi:hypothetical protein
MDTNNGGDDTTTTSTIRTVNIARKTKDAPISDQGYHISKTDWKYPI